MADTQRAQGTSLPAEVSNAIGGVAQGAVRPRAVKARASFAGPDALVCVVDGGLLPAERKLTELGDPGP